MRFEAAPQFQAFLSQWKTKDKTASTILNGICNDFVRLEYVDQLSMPMTRLHFLSSSAEYPVRVAESELYAKVAVAYEKLKTLQGEMADIVEEKLMIGPDGETAVLDAGSLFVDRITRARKGVIQRPVEGDGDEDDDLKGVDLAAREADRVEHIRKQFLRELHLRGKLLDLLETLLFSGVHDDIREEFRRIMLVWGDCPFTDAYVED